jgi:hypothetical protein
MWEIFGFMVYFRLFLIIDEVYKLGGNLGLAAYYLSYLNLGVGNF